MLNQQINWSFLARADTKCGFKSLLTSWASLFLQSLKLNLWFSFESKYSLCGGETEIAWEQCRGGLPVTHPCDQKVYPNSNRNGNSSFCEF